MEKVYVVSGKSDVGKTQFIRAMFIWLLAYGWEFENLISEADGIINGVECGDYLDIFGICKNGKKSIALLSAGDDEGIVGLVKNKEIEQANILICAITKNEDDENESVDDTYIRERYYGRIEDIFLKMENDAQIRSRNFKKEVEKIRNSLAEQKIIDIRKDINNKGI